MKRVLLIEDDFKIRMLLKRLLEKKFRLTVYEADNGLNGLEVYRTQSPELIFLDVGMPVMNGVEFLEELRKTDTKIPVVVLTCFNSKEAVHQMVTLGITDYVIKTDFILRLEERINDILEKVRISMGYETYP
jgi:CheY-like chemotaxis protein